jgi:O-antigen/teichoic acid export membrane protein
MRQLITGGSFLLVGTGVQLTVAFAGNLILMRHLTPEEVGHFAAALAISALAFAIGTLKLDICIFRVPDQDFSLEMKRRYFTASLYETALATFLACFAMQLSGMLDDMTFLLVIANAANHFAGVQKGFFMRRLPYLRLAIVETAAPVIGHIIAVGLVLVGAGARSLYLREIVSASIAVLGLIAVGGLVSMRPKAMSWSDWRALWRDARAVWLDSVLEGVFQRISVLAATVLTGAYGAGLVFQAQRLAVMPHQLAHQFLRAAVAWSVRTASGADRLLIYRRLFIVFALALTPLAILLAFYSDPIVPFLLGTHWAPAAFVLSAMSLMIPCLTLYELLRAYAMNEKRDRLLLGARVVQLGSFIAIFAVIPLGVAASAELIGAALSIAYLASVFSLLPLIFRKRAAV